MSFAYRDTDTSGPGRLIFDARWWSGGDLFDLSDGVMLSFPP
ncbi:MULTISPECIES: hypothetical protein [Mycolicibacterium]|uniref:Uncharacterized protein n=1 Tax=Mycolicibacterium chitae TaxID=1792 RepID=A0A448I6I4_MYCCI|nr:hypothetical protein [Mycolicibacterium chitae]VEG48118.1 Uncharacterised protein [Mycolicibacterium chitae]